MKTFIKLALIIFALLGSQTAACAEQVNESVKDSLESNNNHKNERLSPNQGQDEIVADSPNIGVTFWDFIKMIFALLFVIALLYSVLKFINKKSRAFQASQLVENLGGTSLGANRSVQMIKVGNSIFVVGVAESIQLLKEINDEQEYEQIIHNYNNRMEQLIQPSDIVTRILEKAKIMKVSKKVEDSSFAAILRKQLDEFSKGRKNVMKDIEKEGLDKRE